MKVVLSGVFYPVAILRYFEAALRRRDDVELFTVGAYTGTSIPWAGGMNLPQKYAVPPDMPLPTQLVAGIGWVENQLPWKPDLWLQIDAGYYFKGRPNHGKNFIVATDPHCLNYDVQRTVADKFFCMQTPYMKEGDEWLPYAYDPVWHAPVATTHESYYDTGLIGAPYDNRTKLVKALREQGFSVLFPGYGPSYEEARQMYGQCLTGLNWSSLQDLTARVFELSAMGLCPIINRVPDLHKMGFVEGIHYMGFDNVPEGVEAVRKVIGDKRLAEAIGIQARSHIQPHTWDARIDAILEFAQ